MDHNGPTLSQEMAALQQRIREIQEELDRNGSAALPRVVSSIPAPSYASYARSLVTAQQRLSRYFDIDLFCSPVLHMMLEIFAAAEEQRPITVDDACKASAIPPSTARRWLNVLQTQELIVHMPEQATAECVVSLTPNAANRLRAWLAETASVPLRREWQE